MQAPAIEAFFRAALIGLRALESRAVGKHRFGPNPEATWAAFCGELATVDRLEWLLRDASVAHSAAFAARRVFSLSAVSEDEAFGAEWPSLEDAVVERLWQQHGPAPAGAPSAVTPLREAAAAWGFRPGRTPVPELGKATQLLACGVGASLALASAFDGKPALDLADQVLLISDVPAERQLFGLACALLGSAGPVRILPEAATAAAVKEAGFTRAREAVISEDVTPERRAHLQHLLAGT